MVKSRWIQSDFDLTKRPLEQRIYSSRLLGQDRELVLHGGGNTSVKDETVDIFEHSERVLLIKGSGINLETIDARGFSTVRLDPLLRLRKLPSLSDRDLLTEIRHQLIHFQDPDPSVEILLHAFLPHKFIDHTHSNAILTLSNQPRGEEHLRTLYGNRVSMVPYTMPGLKLGKICVEAFEKNPKVEGMILLQHGIITFGDSAKQSYDRMISLVQEAEKLIHSGSRRKHNTSPLVEREAIKIAWIQVIRSVLLTDGFRCVLLLDDSMDSMTFVNHSGLAQIASQGPLTPDHVTRTKRLPLCVPQLDVKSTDKKNVLLQLLRGYKNEYQKYFERNCHEKRLQREMLDPWPRVILVPGVGIVTAGATHKDAQVTLDIFIQTANSILSAESMDGYKALTEDHFFDVEYWDLQQAKLRLNAPTKALTGKIAVVTGGASGIGLSIVKKFLNEGAVVYVLDLNESLFSGLANELKPLLESGNSIEFIKTDVSNRSSVASAINQVILGSGGIDIFVVNAGILPASHSIDALPEEEWERSLKINLGGAFHSVAETLKWMKEQNAGGDIIFIASKNVPAPGPKAAAYSVAKAGQTQLARVCALEAGAYGIRVNMLHPHLIFDTGIWTEEIIEQRAKAYGMTSEQYRKNNLLRTELSSQDVAEAAFALVAGYFSKTTGAQISIDGGSERTV